MWTRRVIPEFNVLPQFGRQFDVRQVVFGDEERGGQVEQSIHRKHLQPRVFAHGVGQVAGHVGIAQGLRLPRSAARARGCRRPVGVVPHLVDIRPARIISLFRGVLQFTVQIFMERGDEGAGDPRARRVVAGGFPPRRRYPFLRSARRSGPESSPGRASVPCGNAPGSLAASR